jgi:hypothetical protein
MKLGTLGASWQIAIALVLAMAGLSEGTIYPHELGNSNIYIVGRDVVEQYAGVNQVASVCDVAVSPPYSGYEYDVVFVLDQTWDRVLAAYQTGSMSSRVVAFGPDVPGHGTLSSPHGLAVDRWGDEFIVIITDTGNNRMVELSFDGNDFQFVRVFGEGDNLSDPLGVDVVINHWGLSEYVYVADTGNDRVVIYVDGVFHSEYTGSELFPPLSEPTDISVPPRDSWGIPSSYLYVADAWNNRVLRLGNDGGNLVYNDEYVFQEQFSHIVGLDTDIFEIVYVVDEAHCKVHKLSFFDILGPRVIFTYGGCGAGMDEILGPGHLCIPRGHAEVGLVEMYTNITGGRYYWIDLDIEDVRAEPAAFNPSAGESTRIWWSYTDIVDLDLEHGPDHYVLVVDSDSSLVIRLPYWKIYPGGLWEGTHYVDWNGRSMYGEVVPPGEYTCVVHGEDIYDGPDDYPTAPKGTVVQVLPGGSVADESTSATPSQFALRQPFPNPFNPMARIEYAVPIDCKVSIRVYDVQGRLVRSLVDRDISSGYHDVFWDGTDDKGVARGPGVYFCTLSAPHTRKHCKLVLVK